MVWTDGFKLNIYLIINNWRFPFSLTYYCCQSWRNCLQQTANKQHIQCTEKEMKTEKMKRTPPYAFQTHWIIHLIFVLLNSLYNFYLFCWTAFVSWLRYISSFPKDLRTIFNVKNAHMGHYAKSLALREPPKSFTKQFSQPKAPLPQNRLTYTDR